MFAQLKILIDFNSEGTSDFKETPSCVCECDQEFISREEAPRQSLLFVRLLHADFFPKAKRISLTHTSTGVHTRT